MLTGAALIVGVASVGACGNSSSVSARSAHGSPSPEASGLGALPTYLPTSALTNDAPLVGSATDPAVTSQGDEVRTLIGGALVSTVVTGPEVPGEGLPVQQPATTCTWTVTMRAGAKAVRVSVAQFDAIDHFGHVYRLAPVPGRPAVPSTLGAGRSVSFEVRAVMTTGEGLMRWAPDGRHVVGSWDFTVEND